MRSRLLPAILVTIALAGILGGIAMYFRGGFGSGADMIEDGESETASADADSAAQPVHVETNLNPDLTVDENGLSRAVAVIRTKHGDVKFRFYTEDAPRTVSRVVELINEGFYNGLTFHRYVPGFVIQGGDPQGNGTGGSGKRLRAEFNKRQHVAGTVAMAPAADPDSADSQFYIALSPQPHLDEQYTVFGQVVEGMDAVRSLRPGDAMLAVYIEKTQAQEDLADEEPTSEGEPPQIDPAQAHGAQDPTKPAPASQH